MRLISCRRSKEFRFWPLEKPIREPTPRMILHAVSNKCIEPFAKGKAKSDTTEVKIGHVGGARIIGNLPDAIDSYNRQLSIHSLHSPLSSDSGVFLFPTLHTVLFDL